MIIPASGSARIEWKCGPQVAWPVWLGWVGVGGWVEGGGGALDHEAHRFEVETFTHCLLFAKIQINSAIFAQAILAQVIRAVSLNRDRPGA